MILPIVAYGTPVLKNRATEIPPDYPNLSTLIENLWETMYSASGVGLAAPQVGISIRLFVVDASPFAEDETLSEEEIVQLRSFKKVFINPVLLSEEGETWPFNEGCLSIPEVREDVHRKEKVTLEYQDELFNKHKLTLKGLAARVVQHEYDHIEGILFTDYLSPLKKRLLKNRLNAISKGTIAVEYPMKFPIEKKRK